jgi:heme-degrading monooxygenase HmoA
MWAQLQRTTSNPGNQAKLLSVFDQLKAIEQEDSGLQRTLVMRNQKDPSEVFVLVIFDSEEAARAREQDPRRQEGLTAIRAALGDAIDGPPEFFDLDVIRDA